MAMVIKKERKPYYDGVKLVAIFIVFATHFIADFHDEYFVLWSQVPTSFILGGITGKLGVAFFSVILGYFAYKSSEPSIIAYSAKRYIYFLACEMFINGVYGVLGVTGVIGETYPIAKIIRASVTLSDSIYPTLWCIRPFFFASVFSRINGKAHAGLGGLFIEILIIMRWGHTWTAICLLGNIVAELEDCQYVKKLAQNRFSRIMVYAIVLILIKRVEGEITYYIYGVCASAIMLVLPESRIIKKALEWKPLASQGKNTMAIYLIHVIVYTLIGEAILKEMTNGGSYAVVFLIAMSLSWLTIIALSYTVTKILNIVSKIIIDAISIHVIRAPQKKESVVERTMKKSDDSIEGSKKE